MSSNQINQGCDDTASMCYAACETGWCKRVWGGETVGLGCIRRSFLTFESEGLSKGVTFRMKPEWHQGIGERTLLVQKTVPARNLSQEQPWPILSCWRADLAKEKWTERKYRMGKKKKKSRTKSFRVSQANVRYFPQNCGGNWEEHFLQGHDLILAGDFQLCMDFALSLKNMDSPCRYLLNLFLKLLQSPGQWPCLHMINPERNLILFFIISQYHWNIIESSGYSSNSRKNVPPPLLESHMILHKL